MNPTRVFALRWSPGDAPSQRRAQAHADMLREQGWRELIGGRRGVYLLVRSERSDVLDLPNEMGALVGPIFARADNQPLTPDKLSVQETERWCESQGSAFSENHWGNYLALLHDRRGDALHVLRDPMGAGACYMAERHDIWALFTHASDFAGFAGDLECDRDFLAAFLVSPRLMSWRTGIKGVEEIAPGERASFARDLGWTCAPFWRPHPRGPQMRDFEAAGAELKTAVEASAKAWSVGAPRILHRLSGGLDSSIVLANLAGAPDRCDIVCINEFPSGVPEGDERGMARLVAGAFGAPLIELEIAAADVAYERVLGLELSAKPSLSELSFAGVKFAELAGAGDFDLLTSGQGGDQVLHRNRSPEIAADAVRDGLSLDAVMTIALDTARLGRRPVWDVLGAALRYGLLRRPFDHVAGFLIDSPLAPADARRSAERLWREHAWLADVEKAPPARGRRMLRIGDLQFYHQPSVLNAVLPNAMILASEPVVDLCLRVPPYVMTQGGRDRALARAVFASALPEAVLTRSLKGDTTRHFTAVIEHNFDVLRSLLIGGCLVEEGLVENAALETALARRHIVEGRMTAGLMQCLTVELWLRRFKARVSAVAATMAPNSS